MRDYGERYINEYEPALNKIKLIRAMRVCKTPALGGRNIKCTKCQNDHYTYFSCGHSHCPICQSIKREQWVDKIRSELYAVPYVHIVFTLPHDLNRLAKSNPTLIYGLLMRSSWATIKKLSLKSSNVGALPGMVSVLHTFGSDMKYHVHTHNLVTFGGLKDGKWLYPKRKDKIARYREMCSVFKTIFLKSLKSLFDLGEITYHKNYKEVIADVKDKRWVVHNTHPTLDTRILENYLARYINRIAISNSRIRYVKEVQTVQIRYNDYRNQKHGEAAPKAYRYLDPLVAIHQIMQHVLPSYFQKSRRYGLHSNATKRSIEASIPDAVKRNGKTIRTILQILNELLQKTPYRCERCKSTDHIILEVKADRRWIHKYLHIPTSNKSPPMKKNTTYRKSALFASN